MIGETKYRLRWWLSRCPSRAWQWVVGLRRRVDEVLKDIWDSAGWPGRVRG